MNPMLEERKLWWRMYRLGYSLQRFGPIDMTTGAATYSGKYMWIAYYELQGYLEDLGRVPPPRSRPGGWHQNTLDFDDVLPGSYLSDYPLPIE
jgi:hypothetical protein